MRLNPEEKAQIETQRRVSRGPKRFLPGGHREGDIPDPIPNSEVKSFLADGTVHKSMVE